MSADFSKLESINSQLKEFDLIKVPEYQRSYSWEKEYVEVFWNDIVQSIDEKREKYFIGPIITKSFECNKVELIDGQQRLTTSLILLSVIRRIFLFEFQDTGDNAYLKLHDSLSERFFNKDEILGKVGDPIYEMNSENRCVYDDFVVADAARHEIERRLKSLKSNDSNYKLLDALIYLWDMVFEYCGHKFDREKLQCLAGFVLEKLQVLNIRVTDEADAFLIFETINDRGRELDAMDLVKNLVFSKSGSKLSAVKDNWIKMTAILSTLDSYSDFLSQYWISQFGHFVKSNLFKLIREHLNKPGVSVLQFSDSIYEAAKCYVAINNVDNEYWKEHEKETRHNLSILRSIGAKAVNPIIMAALPTFNKEQMSKLVKYLKVFQVRYVIISENRTSRYSSALSDIPPLIRSGELDNAMKVARKLKDSGVYVSDDEFYQKFAEYVAPNTKRAKYLLSEIESFVSGDDKITNDDGLVVNVEHLMPQSPNSDWNLSALQIKSEDYDTWCNRLGNLFLMNSKLNKEAKNLSFAEKMKKFLSKEIKFETTKVIFQENKWDKVSITARQKYLAENAVKVWSIQF